MAQSELTTHSGLQPAYGSPKYSGRQVHWQLLPRTEGSALAPQGFGLQGSRGGGGAKNRIVSEEYREHEIRRRERGISKVVLFHVYPGLFIRTIDWIQHQIKAYFRGMFVSRGQYVDNWTHVKKEDLANSSDLYVLICLRDRRRLV